MKKTRRLLSALTALAITASAFAGLAIPAGAADNAVEITQNFDGEITNGANYTWDVTASADWSGSNKGLSLTANADKAILTFTGGAAGLSKDLKVDLKAGTIKSFDQTAAEWGLVFKTTEGDELFTLKFHNGGGWARYASLVVDGNEQKTDYAFTDSAYTDLSAYVSFGAAGGKVTFGNKSAKFASGSDIGSITAAYNGTKDWDRPFIIDDLTVKTVDKQEVVFDVSSTEAGQSVHGAVITVGDDTYTVHANVTGQGSVTAYYLPGEYDYNVKLAKHKALNAKATVTAEGDNTIPVQLQYVGASVPERVVVGGGDEYIYLPASGTTVSKAFTATVYDNADLVMDNAEVEWSLPGQPDTISIGTDGVVTLTPEYTLTDDNGVDVVVRATVKGTQVTGDASIHIHNTARATSWDVVGPAVIKDGTPAEYTVENVIDQYKNPYDGEVSFTLTSTDANAVIDGLKITPNVGVSRTEEVTLTTTLTSDTTKTVEKKVTVYGYDFYEPAVDELSTTATGARFTEVNEINSLVWPEGGKSTTITLPSPVALEAGSAKMITFDNIWIKQTVGSQERSLRFKNSAGADVIAIDFAGASVVKGVQKESGNFYGDSLGTLGTAGETTSAIFILKTDASGITTAVLSYNKGTAVEFVVAEEPVTDIASIVLTSGAGAPGDRLLTLTNLIIGDSDVAEVEISGDDKIAKISGLTASKQFRGSIFSQAEDETFTWSVADEEGNPIDGVTIDQKGILYVEDTVPAEIKAVISYTSSVSTADAPKLATHGVTIKDYASVASFELDGPIAVNAGDTVTYRVKNVVDEYGDNVVMPVKFEITDGTDIAEIKSSGTPAKGAFVFNNVSADKGVLIRAYYDSNNVLKTLEAEDAAITDGKYTAVSKAKGGLTELCYLWESLDSMKPLGTAEKIAPETDGDEESGTSTDVLSTGKLGNYTVKAIVGNPGKTAEKTLTATVSKYAEAGESSDASVVVDVSELANYAADTKYLVTTATADGKLVKQTETAHTDGKVTVDMTGAAKYEVSPIYSYDNVGNVASGKEIALSDGRYQFTFTKANTARADIYVNGLMVGNNVDQNGKGTAQISSSLPYTVNDVLVQGGKAVVTMKDNDSNMKSIVIKKDPSILGDRKKHLYVLGDSLVANYQLTGDKINATPAAGDAQTGWGEVLDKFISDDLNVTNIAESGNYAEGLYSPAFTSALASAEEGDYILIECGYNDSNYSSASKMSATLTKMAEECKNAGVVLIMSGPNFGPARGDTNSGSAKFTSDIIKTANETGVLGINLSAYGKAYYEAQGWTSDYWSKNFNVYYSGASQDTLHLSYHGAMLHASLIAQAIYDAQNDTENAELAETLKNLKIDTTAYNLTDSEGKTITLQVK